MLAMKRWTLLLLNLAIVCLLSFSAVYADQQYPCIKFTVSGYPGIFDPNTGKVSGPYQTPIRADVVLISPDQRYIAYATHTDTDFGDNKTLFMKSLVDINSDPVIVHKNVPVYDYDLVWSPDSRWLLHYWSNPDSSFVMDMEVFSADGSQTVTAPMGADTGAPFFNGWSADSRYFTFTNSSNSLGDDPSNSQSRQDLVVWSVPDLKIVNQKTATDVMLSSCGVPGPGGMGNEFYCANWSPTGSGLAYARSEKSKAQVVLQNFGQEISKSFDITGEPTNLVWSANGQYVAVRIDGEKPHGDIFGLNGEVYRSAAGAINDTPGGEGALPPDMLWSPDSKTFYDVEQVSKGEAFGAGFYTIKGFKLTSKTSQALLTHLVGPLQTLFATDMVIDPHPSYAFNKDYSYLVGKTSTLEDPSDPNAVVTALVVNATTLKQIVLLKDAREVFWLSDNQTTIAVGLSKLAWFNVIAEKVHTFEYPEGTAISQLEMTPDGHSILFTNNDNNLIALNADTGKSTTLIEHTNAKFLLAPTGSSVLASTPDGLLIISPENQKPINLFSTMESKPVVDVTNAQWSPDGSIVMLVQHDANSQTVYLVKSNGDLIGAYPNFPLTNEISFSASCGVFPK